MKKMVIFIAVMLMGLRAFSEIIPVKSITDVKADSDNKEFYTVILKETKLNNGLILPCNSTLYSEIERIIPERYGRRNSYIIIRPLELSTETEIIPLEGYNLEARTIGYKINIKPDIKKIGANAGIKMVSVMLPGSEQVLKVSKGLLIGEDNKTRIEAARDNLIDSTPLRYMKKGKKIDIENGDRIILKIYKNK